MNTPRRRRSVAAFAAAGLVALAIAPAALGADVGPRAVQPIGGLLVPVAVDDSMTMKHDRTKTMAAPGVLGNDVQLEPGYTAVLVSGVGHGNLDLDADGGYVYRPNAGYVGSDSFKYKVDGGLLGLSNTATVSITVTNVAPVANPDSYSAVAGVEKSVGTPGLLGNDDDADGDSLVVDVVTEPSNGNLNEDDDGSFRYKSDDGFSGTDTFTYRVFDGAAWSNTTTVTMTVSAPAPTPTPTPTPTPAPTPTPKPTATPTPKPTASPTPTPLALPTASILPLPTITLPLPTPTATATPTPGPTAIPGATATPTPGATGLGATPSAGATPTPGATATTGSDPTATTPPRGGPGSVVTPAPTGTPDSEPTDSPAGAGGTGAGGGSAQGDRFVLPAVEPAGIDAVIDASFAGFSGVEWAVPAFALGVPGLLLMIAVGAQALVGVAWLPFVRRWLGGFGVRLRQRQRSERLRA